MLQDFKTFIMRASAVDLAIGIVRPMARLHERQTADGGEQAEDEPALTELDVLLEI